MKQKSFFLRAAACALLCAGLCGCAAQTIPGDSRQKPLLRTEKAMTAKSLAALSADAHPALAPENKNDTFEPGKITVNNSDFTLSEAQNAELTGIMGKYRPYKAGFYVLDLASGMSVGYAADEYFMPACTIKAGYALSWFEKLEQNRIDRDNGVAEDPQASRLYLDSTYLYTGADYLVGAGRIQYQGTGRTYTIKEILYHLIHESDNTAYNILYKKFGNTDYIALSERLGLQPFLGQYGMWTRIRPLDEGLIWQEIWRYKQTQSPEAQLFWEYLTTNLFCEIKVAGIEADEIAHKSGSDEYAFNEAGIVRRGEDAYVVTVFTNRPLSVVGESYDECHELIVSLDNLMQDFYAKNNENRVSQVSQVKEKKQ